MQKLCQILEESAQCTIPKMKIYKDSNFRRLSQWKDLVKPSLEVFRYWSAVLVITPTHARNLNHIKLMKQKAKTRYKWALKKSKKITAENIANSLGLDSCFKLFKNKNRSSDKPPSFLNGNEPENQLLAWDYYFREKYKSSKTPVEMNYIQDNCSSSKHVQFGIDDLQDAIKLIDRKSLSRSISIGNALLNWPKKFYLDV